MILRRLGDPGILFLRIITTLNLSYGIKEWFFIYLQ
jgi:hypothetical protein